MRRFVRRALLPMLLLVAGACALVYGGFVHSLPVAAEVLVEKERTVFEKPSAWPGNRGLADVGSRGPLLPPPPPRPKKVKVQEAEEQVQPTREPKLIREVSVGGVTRLEDGRLKLTYRAGEDGPALCPT